jgi:antitoxin ParD1/3/4
MNVSLSAELENFVNDRVKSGSFKTPSDVINEALRVLQQREALIAESVDRLRKQVQTGIDQLNRGEWIDGEEAMEQLRQKLLARKGSATK